jgi:acetyl esterase/lipase
MRVFAGCGGAARAVGLTLGVSLAGVGADVAGAQGTAALRTAAPVRFEAVAAVPVAPPTAVVTYGAAPEQFGRLRLPAGPGPHPVVLFLHGGCWLSQYDIAHAAALEQALADSGYAVWSLEYRRVGNAGGGWPGTWQDVARGADHLRELAQRHPLDLSRVIAAGHSAGGYFALWLAARDKLPAASPLAAANPLPVRGVLALAPAPDLEGLHAAGVCGKVIDRLMGGSPEAVPERYAQASLMQLAPIAVPTEVVMGAEDGAWRPAGEAYLKRAAERGDRRVHTVVVPGAGHFDVIAPFAPAWRDVMAGVRALLPR